MNCKDCSHCDVCYLARDNDLSDLGHCDNFSGHRNPVTLSLDATQIGEIVSNKIKEILGDNNDSI